MSTLRRRNPQEDTDITNTTATTTPTFPGAPNTAATVQGSLFTEQVAKPSRHVCTQRSIFLAVLIAVSIFATVFMHESTANREEALFQSNFESLAFQMEDNFLTSFEIKILTISPFPCLSHPMLTSITPTRLGPMRFYPAFHYDSGDYVTS